jgi:hypothetical protein
MGLMKNRSRSLVFSSLLLTLAAPLAAQQPAAAPAAPALPIPAVGDMAPDFSARGATRYGMLREPVRLSDYRGQTVVLWLFVKARTRG